MPWMPCSYMRSTISLSSCRHSKYADSGWYPALTSVSKPALTSSTMPPHSTTCSPKRSVSVSSSNVVCSTPARVAQTTFEEETETDLFERGLQYARPGGADADH